MNTTELFHQDGRSAGVFYCGECRLVHRTKELTDQCCAPNKCSICGKDKERYYTKCPACLHLAELQKEQERFEKAEKLTKWDGWVYLEGTGSDGYSESVDAFIEDWEDNHDENEPLPAYVWTCEENHFVNASVEDITQQMADSAYEHWEPDSLKGLPELQTALDKFNEANKDAVSFQPDYKVALLLAPIKTT